MEKKAYQPLIIPINKPFEQLKKNEAKAYFDWFMENINRRSDYIRLLVADGLGISIEQIDYSEQSLILIWRWFLNNIEITKTPKKILRDIKKELKKNKESDEFIEDMIREHSMELSIVSRYIIRDIAMYVGKMFVSKHAVLRWDYHTNIKQDSFANMPQIFGFIDNAYNLPFEMQFEPIHFVEMEASNIFDNSQSETDLLEMYMRWCQWIPK